MKSFIIFVAVLGVLGAMVLYRASSAKDARDDAVIDQLRAAGSDLSKPHPLDFYIYVPTEEAARRVAATLTGEGFQVAVRTAATGPGWLALASKTLVPSPAALASIRQRLTKVAATEGGEYDGWEAQSNEVSQMECI
jgi:hypothetical protein